MQINCKQKATENVTRSYIRTEVKKKIFRKKILYDFGESYFGKILIQAKVLKFDSIYITFGDILNTDGITIKSIPKYFPSKIKIYLYPNIIQYDVFEICKLKSERPFELTQSEKSLQMTFPFRYVAIENNNNVKIIKVYQKYFINKFNDTLSSFTSSDYDLNRIWELSKHTIKATNFTNTFIDGDRERRPYEGDAHINLLSYFQLDTSKFIAKNTLEYLIDNPTWPTEYNLLLPELFYNYTLYTGDIDLINKHFNQLVYKTLIDLRNKDGIISTNSGNNPIFLQYMLGYKNYKNFIKQLARYKKPVFYNLRDMVDWPQKSIYYDKVDKKYINIIGENDNFEYKHFNSVINAYHYNSLVMMHKISIILKKNKLSNFFLNKSFITKKSFHKYFYNSKIKLFVDGYGSNHSSLHSNVFALKFCLVKEEQKKDIIEYIKNKGMACSPFCAQFMLDALFDNNEGDFAIKLITKNSNRSWKNMLNNNASMTFESWDTLFNPEMDLSHSWSTSPLNIVNRKIWGIEPCDIGFKSFLFNPKFGSIKYSKLRMPTIHGLIEGSYVTKGDKKIITLNFPNTINGKIQISTLPQNNLSNLISGKSYEIN